MTLIKIISSRSLTRQNKNFFRLNDDIKGDMHLINLCRAKIYINTILVVFVINFSLCNSILSQVQRLKIVCERAHGLTKNLHNTNL